MCDAVKIRCRKRRTAVLRLPWPFTAWSPEHREPVLHGLHVILNEEWEHLRFAPRDLDAQTTWLAPPTARAITRRRRAPAGP
jgi:hypothetical protein